jgi:hypothetical protein
MVTYFGADLDLNPSHLLLFISSMTLAKLFQLSELDGGESGEVRVKITSERNDCMGSTFF